MTATYNFVFFIVLGYTPLFLKLSVIPLGLAFTGWGLGLAVGILGVGHRLAHRIGAVQTLGVAIVGLLACMALFATSRGLVESLIVLVAAGLFMGLANANLTDLALVLGSSDRRVATGAFNLVRWGAAAPAPVAAGLLAEHGATVPYWVGLAVLGAGLLVYVASARTMTRAARPLPPAPVVATVPEEVLGEVY